MIERISSRIAALVAGVLLTLPTLAQAADPHGEEGAPGAADAAHESPNLFSVDPGLMIWTIVTFLVVLTILRFTAWNPLMNALAEREKSISGAIEDAQRIKSEAETLLAQYETRLDKAKDEAQAILEEARKDGIAVQEDFRARAQKEAEEFKERARKEIELAKDAALQDIWNEAASLSTELATRILGRSLDGSDQERLVRELIEEMKGEMNGDGKARRHGAEPETESV